ncbi:MAG: IclR family transcriptional regulator, partial [Proteobacteria bacterium]|nr:IclR family transcriptional regulator [Pseudomonadota bacterium]
AVALPKPTVHRLLRVLCAHEVLSKSGDDGSYALGPFALALGARALGRNRLRQLGQPVLRRLAAQTGESALMFELAPTRDAAICIEQIESSHGLRLVSEVGVRLPLFAGASSRAILAFMPDDEIAGVLAALPKARDVAPLSRKELERQIQGTRRLGYAQSFEETSPGACGIAAPLFAAGAAVVGCLTIAGPTTRLTRARLLELAPTLLAAAGALSTRIGGAPARRVPRRAAACRVDHTNRIATED